MFPLIFGPRTQPEAAAAKEHPKTAAKHGEFEINSKIGKVCSVYWYLLVIFRKSSKFPIDWLNHVESPQMICVWKWGIYTQVPEDHNALDSGGVMLKFGALFVAELWGI